MTVSDIAPRIHSPARDERSPGSSLAALLTDLSIRQLEVISAPDGLNRPVRGAVIWEGVRETQIGTGDLVLAVGATGAAELSQVVAVAADNAAAAVIARRPEDLDLLRAEAALHEMTVLCMGTDMTWHQLHSSLTAALATTRSLTQSSLGVLDGDLFALADAAAASLGGPVEIDDTAMQPLAYSNIDDDVDELRRTSILTRHPPAELMEWLGESGLLHRIRTTHHPIRVEPSGSRARLAMPIRAGVDLLGYVWLAEGTTPIEEVDPRDLIDAARVAAGLMMRLRTVNTERRLPTELLRSALEGVGCPDVLISHFPHHDEPQFRLIGFHIPSAELHRSDQRPTLLQNLVALRAESAGYPAIATSRDDMVYVLLNEPPQSAPRATTPVARAQAFAELVVAHAGQQLGTALVAAVGHSLADLSTLQAARLEVDRLAALISKTGPAVGTADGLRTRAVLAELRELTRDRPHLLNGPIETLRQLDETKGTEYLVTLRAYFDAQHDLAGAGKLLCVHRNTVRYRIARMQELCHMDLVSPTERLVLELQLHLLAD